MSDNKKYESYKKWLRTLDRDELEEITITQVEEMRKLIEELKQKNISMEKMYQDILKAEVEKKMINIDTMNPIVRLKEIQKVVINGSYLILDDAISVMLHAYNERAKELTLLAKE